MGSEGDFETFYNCPGAVGAPLGTLCIVWTGNGEAPGYEGLPI